MLVRRQGKEKRTFWRKETRSAAGRRGGQNSLLIVRLQKVLREECGRVEGGSGGQGKKPKRRVHLKKPDRAEEEENQATVSYVQSE